MPKRGIAGPFHRCNETSVKQSEVVRRALMPSKGLPMPSDVSEKRSLQEPSPCSVDRMLAFAALLAAVERGDARETIEARARLRALGVTVRFEEVAP